MSSTPTIQELLAMARDENILSQAGFTSLAATTRDTDLANRMNAVLGAPASSYTAKRVVIVGLLVDDSSSIASRPTPQANNEQAVRDSNNEILAAIQDSKQGGEVLIFTQFINGDVLNRFVPIEQAIRLDSSNYAGMGGTPFYDSVATFLATLIAKAAEFANEMVEVHVIATFLTDGNDEHSRNYLQPEDVRPAVHDTLQSEDPGFIILGWGVEDGQTDFHDIFTRMGLLPQWILICGSTPSEIRRAAKVASRSAAQASQNAASFSKTAAEGLQGFMQ